MTLYSNCKLNTEMSPQYLTKYLNYVHVYNAFRFEDNYNY